MDHKRVIYYKDLNNDDFVRSVLDVEDKPLGDKFKWHRTNPIYHFIGSIIYYIAIPFMWLFTKLVYNVKVVGKKKLRKKDLKGAFIYGNHTQEADGIFSQIYVTNPYRTCVVCGQETVNIKGIRWIVMMLGALPIPKTPTETPRFIDAVKYHHEKGHPIVIFPEAHIWPYTTVIREFPDSSFTYPAQLNAPVCAICTTYEERKILRNLPPRVVIHVSDVIYPDASLPLGERAHSLREQVYNFMVDKSSSLDNYEYIHYVFRPEETNEFDTTEEIPVVKQGEKDDDDITFKVSECK